MRRLAYSVRAITLLVALAVAAPSQAFQLRSDARLPEGAVADRVVVEKGARRLHLYDAQGRRLATFAIALGERPEGHKQRQGDERTPEGVYRIVGRNPGSAYHLSLRISYPDAADRARAAAAGVDPGGDIMIHGLPNGLGWLGPLHRFYDWTDGCIAVTNAEMEQIWRAVPDGTAIEIRP